jgi:hypothetical protein
MEIHPNMLFRYVVGRSQTGFPMCSCTSAPTCVYSPFVMPYRVLQPANPTKNLIIAVHRLPFAADLRLCRVRPATTSTRMPLLSP